MLRVTNLSIWGRYYPIPRSADIASRSNQIGEGNKNKNKNKRNKNKKGYTEYTKLQAPIYINTLRKGGKKN